MAEPADADDDGARPGSSFGSDRRMAWYGVKPASVSGAAWVGSRSPSGTTRRADGTSISGAMPPSQPSPPPAQGNCAWLTQ